MNINDSDLYIWNKSKVISESPDDAEDSMAGAGKRLGRTLLV